MSSTLSSEEREFFRLVSRATFANPFGMERDKLDQRIAKASSDDPDLLERLVQAVQGRLEVLESAGSLRPQQYNADDWELLEHAVLFEAFHRFSPELDALMEAQLKAGTERVPVPFADSLLRLLSERGFESERAYRMFALIWQMRRAYTFTSTGLLGDSPCMRRLQASIWNDLFTHDLTRFERLLWNRLEDFSVIFRGETGTGKGQAALALGRSGFIPFDRKAHTFAASFTELFVPINLSQFPESLIESELFGHKKGAFTGAVDSHAGAFTRCSPHGAIFLDEIGEVSIPVQIKLLKVLEERTYTPVGSHEERAFSGRVIAATHRDLQTLRAEGIFRDDFYYRLSSDVIDVPTLRQRVQESSAELPLLVERLVEQIVGAGDPTAVQLVLEAIERDLPANYAWPGNVRELKQCTRRVLLTGRCENMHLSAAPAAELDELLGGITAGQLEVRELVSAYCRHLYQRLGTYEEVAKITGLDRRTVKKHLSSAR